MQSDDSLWDRHSHNIENEYTYDVTVYMFPGNAIGWLQHAILNRWQAPLPDSMGNIADEI